MPNVKQSPALVGFSDGLRDNHHEGNGIHHGDLEEGVATPVRTFLSSNITPRSSSRKARAGTASPVWNITPKGTPTTSRPVPTHHGHENSSGDGRATNGLGLRFSNSGRRSRTGSIVSDGRASSMSSNLDSSRPRNSETRMSSPENAPKFVHANDINPSVPSRPTTKQPSLCGRSPERVKPMQGTVPTGRLSSSGRSPTPDEQRPKFFYASDSTHSKSTPLRSANESNVNRPQLETIYSTNNASSPPRASSPLKEEMLPRRSSVNKPSPRRHTRLVSNGANEIKAPEAISAGKADVSRRSSLNSPRKPRNGTHARSPSVPTTGLSPSRRSSISVADVVPVERARALSITGANGALPHSVNPPSITNELPSSQVSSQPTSPVKTTATGQSKIDQMNELAANARRERKVLDLEISNSSLLAINRTLEREMRKQNAELRRFRRLSRSGRISIAPSSRSASGKMSIISSTDTAIESHDLVSSSENEDDPTDLLSDVSSTSAGSRPSSFATRTARARFQDPKRIELDLAAHRALLSDSQKLNVSIKRCLALSELLISSGRQALDYHAPIPEHRHPAARVLTPEEIEDEFLGQGQGLLSPSTVQAGTNPWEKSLEGMGDLSIDLETPDYSKWGSPTEEQAPIVNTAKCSSESGGSDDRLDNTDVVRKDVDIMSQGDSQDLDGEKGRASEIASIDGLSDNIDDLPKNGSEQNSHGELLREQARSARSSTDTESSPNARTASPERKEPARSLDPQPGQPGYRGSMQGLGHYLQAFSMFGASQKP